MLLAAGLLARKARERGLAPPPWVKTSLAPGSPAAADYLRRSGLLPDLEALGFGIVGFGCTTCIGNSGPLVPVMAEAIRKRGVVAAAVLSGNRNFPGRVHGMLDHAFLASPPLVVAYALAGRVDLDIAEEPIGLGRDDGARVPRRHLALPTTRSTGRWPLRCGRPISSGAFADQGGGAAWSAIEAPSGPRSSPGKTRSTYLRRPPFVALPDRRGGVQELSAAPIIVLGDDITTDHISPAGAIPAQGEAGRWLVEAGAVPGDLNVFSSRRGNFEVMLRGLFTNRSVRNLLWPGAGRVDDPRTLGRAPAPLPRGRALPMEGVPTVILAGRHYGAGSPATGRRRAPPFSVHAPCSPTASSGSIAPT